MPDHTLHFLDDLRAIFTSRLGATAILCSKGTLTYGYIDHWARAWSNALANAGVAPGLARPAS
jgi:hypothetical protein